MAKINDKDYIFATACVRSGEKNMLNHDKINKMVESKNSEEALKVLTEMEYGGSFPDIKPQDFELLLTREHKKTYEFIKSIVHDPEYFNIFLYQSDYHNIKVILKAEFLDIDPEPFLMDSGSIEAKTITNMIRERDFIGMSTEMKDAVEEVLDVFARTKDPQQVDIILDKACYKDMIRLAEKSENTYLKGYVKLLIDTINLKIFVRMRKMKKNWDFFSKVFIEGGNITEKFFISGYDEQLETFAEKLVSYGLSDVLTESIPTLKENGSFTTLEKMCDNRLMDYVKDSKYKSFGIEAIVGYILAKENEIKSARIIMSGKLAGLSSDRIRERLRESYV